MPILYYSGLNYEDENGKNPKLDGKFQPDRKLLIEDIKNFWKNNFEKIIEKSKKKARQYLPRFYV